MSKLHSSSEKLKLEYSFYCMNLNNMKEVKSIEFCSICIKEYRAQSRLQCNTNRCIVRFQRLFQRGRHSNGEKRVMAAFKYPELYKRLFAMHKTKQLVGLFALRVQSSKILFLDDTITVNLTGRTSRCIFSNRSIYLKEEATNFFQRTSSASEVCSGSVLRIAVLRCETTLSATVLCPFDWRNVFCIKASVRKLRVIYMISALDCTLLRDACIRDDVPTENSSLVVLKYG